MKQHSHLCQPETSAAIVRAQAGRTWRYVAEQLGYPLSFAPTLCAIAHCKPGQVTAEGEQELRRRLGLSYDRLHTVPVPSDHDAAVHMTTNGTGRLDVVYVPDTTQVVIVPAGSQRLAQPKQPSAKPKRERTQKDVTRLKRRGWSDAEIERVLRVMYDYPGDLAAVAEVLAKLEQD